MTETITPQRRVSAPPLRRAPRHATAAGRRRTWLIWGAVGVAVIAASVIWIAATDLRPSYDPFGWLDWGRQVLAGNFNTEGAPSWKPLTFLFTLPYALFAHNPQMWLWMITATAAALAGAVIAGRLAYRLTGPTPGRPWAPWVAAAFAAIGLLGMDGYSQLIMISNSDPMIATLCLAAVDFHLLGRRRLAFASIFLAALGRPEAWVFALLYALWAWRSERSMRWLVTVGIVLIPLAWFIVPALTSRGVLHPGDLALNSPRRIHGNKVIGVIDRLRGLYALPAQLVILYGLVFTLARRQRVWLGIAAAALLWVLEEIAFAYHGWSAVPRLLAEPGALLLVLGGAALGRLLGWRAPLPRWLQWVVVVPLVALLVALIPHARYRARVVKYEIRVDRHAAVETTRLERVIQALGGAARVKACGQPATLLGYQSELAWAIGLNVGSVSFRPGKSISEGKPVVMFKPHLSGWQIRPFHLNPANAQSCQGLRRDTTFGGAPL